MLADVVDAVHSVQCFDNIHFDDYSAASQLVACELVAFAFSSAAVVVVAAVGVVVVVVVVGSEQYRPSIGTVVAGR